MCDWFGYEYMTQFQLADIKKSLLGFYRRDCLTFENYTLW